MAVSNIYYKAKGLAIKTVRCGASIASKGFKSPAAVRSFSGIDSKLILAGQRASLNVLPKIGNFDNQFENVAKQLEALVKTIDSFNIHINEVQKVIKHSLPADLHPYYINEINRKYEIIENIYLKITGDMYFGGMYSKSDIKIIRAFVNKAYKYFGGNRTAFRLARSQATFGMVFLKRFNARQFYKSFVIPEVKVKKNNRFARLYGNAGNGSEYEFLLDRHPFTHNKFAQFRIISDMVEIDNKMISKFREDNWEMIQKIFEIHNKMYQEGAEKLEARLWQIEHDLHSKRGMDSLINYINAINSNWNNRIGGFIDESLQNCIEDLKWMRFPAQQWLQVLEHGQGTKEVNIREILEKAIEACTGYAATKNLEIVPSLNENKAICKISPGLMGAAISNLLNNSIKYSDKGKISVSLNLINDSKVTDSGWAYQIRIKDQGRGIKKEDINKLFKQFSTLKNAGEQRGKGLGLHFVKEIVLMFGGKIDAESDGVGKGMTIIITLPIPDLQ